MHKRQFEWSGVPWKKTVLMTRDRGTPWNNRRAQNKQIAAWIHDTPATCRISMPAGKGKITDAGYDNMACIYTKINSEDDFIAVADLTVTHFLHEPGPNNQEGFGFFVRETIKNHPVTGLYYANMAAAGGYYGRYNLFGRSGIRGNDISHIDNYYLYRKINQPGGVYENDPLRYQITPDRSRRFHLTFRKSGNEFSAELTDMDGKDLLAPAENGGLPELSGLVAPAGKTGRYVIDQRSSFWQQAGKKIYIGFFAARGTEILIHKDDFHLTLLKKDALHPADPARSQEKQSEKSCRYKIFHSGGLCRSTNLPLMQQRNRLREFLCCDACALTCSGMLWKSEKPLHVQLLRDDQAGSGKDPFSPGTCETEAYPQDINKIWHAAPDGTASGDGSRQKPLDLCSAIGLCAAQEQIVLAPGRYLFTESVIIEKRHSGLPGGRKILTGAADGKTVLDFGGTSALLLLSGSYWILENIHVTNGFGIQIEGSYNWLRNCSSFRNFETGFLIRHHENASARRDWPCRNLIDHCLSYENRDKAECNADGFACKVASGPGNIFRGCTAVLNSDDGFDLFTKNRLTGPVTVEDCRSYLNGFKRTPQNGLQESKGNGNGFKLGGSGMRVDHVVTGCVAEGNRQYGFTNNSNPCMILRDCRAVNNMQINIYYGVYHGSRIRRRFVKSHCVTRNDADFQLEAFLQKITDQYLQT